MDYLEWEYGCTISNVSVNGTLDTSHDCLVGGVIGSVTQSRIYGCTNNGKITNLTNGIQGGIVGDIDSSEVKNCNNFAFIEGSGLVGGICGQISRRW